MEHMLALSSFAIEVAVRCACDIRGSSSLKEKQVEAITALMRERDVFVCLPTGSISRCACYALLLICESWAASKESR